LNAYQDNAEFTDAGAVYFYRTPSVGGDGNVSNPGLGGRTNWSPTFTSVANLDSTPVIVGTGIHRRDGANGVTGSIRVTVDPTTTLTPTEFGIAFPFALTTHNSVDDVFGGCRSTTQLRADEGYIEADTTNDRMTVKFTPASVSSYELICTFDYKVL
jgi:hypothetical protein